MKCIKPFTSTWGAFGCGQCLPCRITKRRTWTHRILLEAIDHGAQRCSFVTLTYRDEAQRSLDPVHTQRWLKRLRKSLGKQKVRYFLVGEYGDISHRPHYHAALFGFGPCSGEIRIGGECQCHACSVVRATWGYGHVMVGSLTAKSSAYIAGYCTKKMTHASDTRLLGRHPEFSRMSLNPGIGANAMWCVASEILKYDIQTRTDVPTVLRYGGKLMPLGKYLRKKLREYSGTSEEMKYASLQKLANQMQVVRSFAWSADRSVSSVFQELNEPYAAQQAARISLHERKTI